MHSDGEALVAVGAVSHLNVGHAEKDAFVSVPDLVDLEHMFSTALSFEWTKYLLGLESGVDFEIGTFSENAVIEERSLVGSNHFFFDVFANHESCMLISGNAAALGAESVNFLA